MALVPLFSRMKNDRRLLRCHASASTHARVTSLRVDRKRGTIMTSSFGPRGTRMPFQGGTGGVGSAALASLCECAEPLPV